MKTSMPCRYERMNPYPREASKGWPRTTWCPSDSTASVNSLSIAHCAAQQTWLAESRRSPDAINVIVLDIVLRQRGVGKAYGTDHTSISFQSMDESSDNAKAARNVKKLVFV